MKKRTLGTYERTMRDMRSRYWHALPAHAYRIRRLVGKDRTGPLEPGEREELELLAKRLADSGRGYGFDEVSRIARRITELLEDRQQTLRHDALESACDDLDTFIDDMTIEALALRLRAVLG